MREKRGKWLSFWNALNFLWPTGNCLVAGVFHFRCKGNNISARMVVKNLRIFGGKTQSRQSCAISNLDWIKSPELSGKSQVNKDYFNVIFPKFPVSIAEVFRERIFSSQYKKPKGKSYAFYAWKKISRMKKFINKILNRANSL